MQKHKIYIIWIWWIWISALARYYLKQSYTIYWSDKNSSELIENLEKEWINIVIWENPEVLNNDFDLVIYSEAIPKEQSERKIAEKLWIKCLSYPKALAEIANNKKLITIAWTHWKSTTTSMTSLILKNSDVDFTSIVWTLLKEFWNKNFYHRKDKNEDEYFVLEACEYKKSFLNYKPTVWVITNIELDHIDYYENLENYIESFKQYIENILPGWFAILNWTDENCKKLIGLRTDINYIEVFNEYFIFNNEKIHYPIIKLKVPWEHIAYDSKIAYIVWHMIWIKDSSIINTLESYNWVWRRMEFIWKTVHNNILMSDYWHHPTEIKLTLKSLKDANPDRKILTIFQAHQYSRTFELLEDFKKCFISTDKLIITNIYESRDSKEDKEKINTDSFFKSIIHSDKINWTTLNNSLELIEDYDKNNTNSIILLLWAWDIDNLRYKIKTIY